MKNFMIMFLLLTNMITTNSTKCVAQIPADAIIGDWLSQKKDTRFHIFKQNDKYYGKVLSATGRDSIDVKNPDPKLRRRKLIGSNILKDFVFDGTETWQDGTIYDPAEGKTYACKLSLTKDQKLKIRGYIGISLFGRTEYWTRLKN